MADRITKEQRNKIMFSINKILLLEGDELEAEAKKGEIKLKKG